MRELGAAPPDDGAGDALRALLYGRLERSDVRRIERWPVVVERARASSVGALVYDRLRAAGRLGDVPPAAAAALRDAHTRSTLHARRIDRVLAPLLDALAHDAIPAVLLKGAHLAHVVYRDPALRPMADVDVLVRRGDLARAERSLGALGYQPATGEGSTDYARHHHIVPYRRASGPPVELHWTLSPPDAPFDVDVGALWSRVRPARVTGRAALVLAPEDALLHLCLHAAYNHRFVGAVLPVHDVVAVIRHHGAALDWDALAAVANGAGAGRFVYCMLRVAARTGGVVVPPAVFERLAHDASDTAAVPMIERYVHGPSIDLPITYRRLGDVDGLRRKLGVLVRGLVLSPKEMRRIYGAPRGAALLWWYGVVRPIDLLRRRRRLLLDLVRRAPALRGAVDQEARRRVVDRWIDAAAGRR